MIRIAVCDPDENSIALMREALTGAAIRHDLDLDVLWLFAHMEERIAEHAGDLLLCMVSLDTSQPAGLGRLVYERNPMCSLLYYSDRAEPLEPLLCSRPIHFINRSSMGTEDLAELLHLFIQDAVNGGRVFKWPSRGSLLLLPYNEILYMESRYKNVLIHTRKTTYELWGKLDCAAEKLEPRAFLRLHKSFLVNRAAVRAIRKGVHEAELINGERVPVSKAMYARTQELLTEREDVRYVH